MKTASESVARDFFQELLKELESAAHEANKQKPEDDNYDGFSTENIKDGWIDYRGTSFGLALLEEPYRISFTAGPDGPFVGFKQIFAIQTGDDGKVTLILDGADNVGFESAQQLAKFALNTLTKKRHEAKALD
ncbi:MAG: hypothetical protein SGJ27_23980 [Candidatus Melainabacteria bacterium]|nr:hypothetical protein [Candidatus Melainabacteria bacterium]